MVDAEPSPWGSPDRTDVVAALAQLKLAGMPITIDAVKVLIASSSSGRGLLSTRQRSETRRRSKLP